MACCCSRVATRGALNAPWGLAWRRPPLRPAPARCWSATSATARSTPTPATRPLELGQPAPTRSTSRSVIDGLWGIGFGNGATAGPVNVALLRGGPGRREPRPLRHGHREHRSDRRIAGRHRGAAAPAGLPSLLRPPKGAGSRGAARYRPVTGNLSEGAAPGPRTRRRTSPFVDALAHILLSLLALFGAGARPARSARRDHRQSRSGVPFAISDGAAQRAFPSELIVARAVGISAARLRRLGGDRAAAARAAARPERPRLRLDGARCRHRAATTRSGLERPARVLARARVGQRRARAQRLAADAAGSWAICLRRRPALSAGAPVLRLERAERAGVRPAQHHRGLRADGARHLRRRARGGTRGAGGRRQPRRALPRRRPRDPGGLGARTCAPTASRWISSSVHPYPLRRSPRSRVRDPAHRVDLLDVPALGALRRRAGDGVGVRLVVRRCASSPHQAEWTAQAIEVTGFTPGLAGFVFWGFHDHPVPLGVPADPWVRFGWLDAAGQPKPVLTAAFDALRDPLDAPRSQPRRAPPTAGRTRARSRSRPPEASARG